MGFYNGIDDERHGIHHWARRGMVTRGVLADVARWRAAAGRPIIPGLPIGELFDLDVMADHCRSTGRHAFLFTSAPLNLHAGVATPPNALAVT